MKKLLVLGISGSIGTQTVDVVDEHPQDFEIVGCSVYRNKDYLKSLLMNHEIKHVAIACKDDELEVLYPDVNFYYGESGLCEMASKLEYDVMVNALVGISGLLPTLSALISKKDVALANKETLVIAGDIVNALAEKNGCQIYPIDSEHSAIFQCLKGEKESEVERLIITASGGAFRHLTRAELKNVILQEALHHPTWKMGKKVTIDSATMMNKGFEVIEAHYLFGVDYQNIDVLQHSESIIHSMVEFKDKSVIAQLSKPDMRVAIQYALTYPNRYLNTHVESLDLAKVGSLNFSNIDFNRYPLLALAYNVGKRAGNLGAVLNAADETAIGLFTAGKIAFSDIDKIVIGTVRNANYIPNASLQERFKADAWARKFIKENWRGLL